MGYGMGVILVVYYHYEVGRKISYRIFFQAALTKRIYGNLFYHNLRRNLAELGIVMLLSSH